VTSDHPRPWEVAVFAIAFAFSLCVGLAIIWSATSAYISIAGTDGVRLTDVRTGERVEPIRPVSTIHREWADYVTGRTPDQAALGSLWFTDDERRHMSDVRSVFITAQVVAMACVLAMLGLSLRHVRRTRALRLVRAGALAAALGATLVGAAFAIAFDAAFLLFHEILFPQGNFLFPTGSNLLVIYPERYWYGVTIRIAVTFLATAVVVAGLAHLVLRHYSDARSAIVTPR
jgi:integral membrane protein (TIGR01906 family)